MKTTFTTSTRGSAFISVMGFCAILLLLIASVLKYSTSERQLNGRAKLLLEARSGAEALSEYGVSQVKKVLDSNRTFTDSVWGSSDESSFITGGTYAGAVLLPLDTFWQGSKIIDSTGSTAEKPLMYVGKIMQSGGLTLIDPVNPDNENDPLKGKWAFRYNLDIISRATARDTFAQRNLTSYMKQSFTIRAVPLFSNAVYYNMDMEVQPGPNLTITGSTHTNGRLFCRTDGTNTVSFAGPVTAVKGFWTNFHTSSGDNLMPYFQSINDSGALQTNDQNTVVRILQSGTSTYKTMKLNAATTGFSPNLPNGTWVESTWDLYPTGETWQRHLGEATPVTETTTSKANFANWIQQTFNGNLLTNVNGLTPNRIQGIPDYSYVYGSAYPDPITGSTADNVLYWYKYNSSGVALGNDVNNSAHALVETPRLSSDNSYYKPTEDIKYSRRTGLYISANTTAVTPAAGVFNGHKPDGTPIRVKAHSYRAFKNDGTEVVLPGQDDFGDNNATANPYAAHKNARPIVQMQNIDFATNIETGTYRRMTDMRRTGDGINAAGTVTNSGDNTNATTKLNTQFIHSTVRSNTNKYSPKALFMIDIDIMELKKAVRTINVTPAASYTTTNLDYYDTGLPTSGNYSTFIYNPDANTKNVTLNDSNRIITTNTTTLTNAYVTLDWNGGVYVESIAADLFDTSAGTTAADIARRKAKTHKLHNSGVRLINGRGKVPSLTDSDRQGMTLATNDALYVLGSFNSDGKSGTPATVERLLPAIVGQSTGQYPDDGLDHNSTELPCSLVADAIYLLSQPNNDTYTSQDSGWNDAFSALAKVSTNTSGTWATSAPSGSNRQDGDVAASDIFAFKVPYDSGAGSWSGGGRRVKLGASPFSEYSFAMLCGLVPTGKNGFNQTSGGLHNFPIFLESWSSDTCRIRGSMVALFECRVANDPWNLRTYDPPTRIWGFNLIFADGVMPPLTPKTVNIRRVGTNDIRMADFNQLVSDWGY